MVETQAQGDTAFALCIGLKPLGWNFAGDLGEPSVNLNDFKKVA